MGVRLTDVILCLCSITSIRTSCMWSHNSTLVSMLLLLDNHCMNNWSIKCITSLCPHCQSFGTAYSISNTRRTLICKCTFQSGSYKIISWGIHYFIELVLTERAFQPGSSSNGSYMLSSMLHLYSTAASGYYNIRQHTNLTARILDFGLVVCLCTVFAFSWQIWYYYSSISPIIGLVHSSSSSVLRHTSFSSGFSASASRMK